jgi:predicted porin
LSRFHFNLAALATLAAAGTTFAQSSVELYGIVDLGYHNEKASFNEGGDSFTDKRTGLSSVVSGSRIGFRGTEDLGGGLKAGFVLEYAITPDENNGIGAGASPNRQSFISLTGAFGDVRLGRQLTLHHINQGAGDLLGNLNAQAGYLGGADSVVRQNNAVTYTSPSFSGFTVAVQKGFGETIVMSDAQNEKLGEQQAIRLNYSAGPLAAGYATETIKNLGVAANTGIFTNANDVIRDVLPGVAVAGGTLDKRRANNLYATYDFGVAKMGFVNNNSKFTDENESVKWNANTLTAAVPMGAITIHASMGSGKFKLEAETLKAKAYQLGAQYALSKRTSAYAYTGQTKFTGEDFSDKYQTYSLGLRHTF